MNHHTTDKTDFDTEHFWGQKGGWMMNNVYTPCDAWDTDNASRVLWSNTLLNTRDNRDEDVFSTCSSVLQTTMKPRFSLAHTSLFTPAESLPAFLTPVATRFFPDETETSNDSLVCYTNEDVEQDIAFFTQCLV